MFNIPAIEEYLGDKLECDYPDEELLKELPEPKPMVQKKPDSPKSRNYKNKNQRKSNYRTNYKGKNTRGKNNNGAQNRNQKTSQKPKA